MRNVGRLLWWCQRNKFTRQIRLHDRFLLSFFFLFFRLIFLTVFVNRRRSKNLLWIREPLAKQWRYCESRKLASTNSFWHGFEACDVIVDSRLHFLLHSEGPSCHYLEGRIAVLSELLDACVLLFELFRAHPNVQMHWKGRELPRCPWGCPRLLGCAALLSELGSGEVG